MKVEHPLRTVTIIWDMTHTLKVLIYFFIGRNEKTKYKHIKIGQEQSAYTIGKVHADVITYAKEWSVEEVHRINLVVEW